MNFPSKKIDPSIIMIKVSRCRLKQAKPKLKIENHTVGQIPKAKLENLTV